MAKASSVLIKALAVTAQITGTDVSPEAALVMARDLEAFPEAQVLQALAQCRMELRGRLTIADIVSRIDDGRPGPEEAWARMPRSEAESIVWTDEEALAWGVAEPLLATGDKVAARMAFREKYCSLVQLARSEKRPPHWTPSLGTDPAGRETAVRDAAEKGRITAGHATTLLAPDRVVRQGLPAPHDDQCMSAAVDHLRHIASLRAIIRANEHPGLGDAGELSGQGVNDACHNDRGSYGASNSNGVR
ncbi:MAG: hypothetical protein ACYDHY_15210 [Acidiferrobacterales bacterium]